jgi:hypothetical protein
VLGGDGLLLGHRDQGPREMQGSQLRRGIDDVGERPEQGRRLSQGAGGGGCGGH